MMSIAPLAEKLYSRPAETSDDDMDMMCPLHTNILAEQAVALSIMSVILHLARRLTKSRNPAHARPTKDAPVNTSAMFLLRLATPSYKVLTYRLGEAGVLLILQR